MLACCQLVESQKHAFLGCVSHSKLFPLFPNLENLVRVRCQTDNKLCKMRNPSLFCTGFQEAVRQYLTSDTKGQENSRGGIYVGLSMSSSLRYWWLRKLHTLSHQWKKKQ